MKGMQMTISNWKNDKPTDSIIILSDGTRIKQQQKLKNQDYDLSDIIYNNGDRYKGSTREVIREGTGLMTYSDGSFYVGQWASDVKRGQGDFTDSEKKESYVGCWRNDQRNGRGRQVYADGSEYIGYWNNDLKTGCGILITKDKSI